ncbi:signal recognition particle-docking protein FtsY [Candidatus Nitrosacidococcus sp. I8]|uniref:signal recognition particle-docking protein FtsY n=1 Tax=Candidatus Nitrosacidococcus sp. I8 TaxID=2942908 RepID=UPI002226E8F9|nr:signal recognition particle-docking protein FtsY [Candidatus Nitrosacidococcus sp. I8]CAH9019168.1 Signal recognition particle receptor FtsY [Candidatus Nitrosacidococcus sp. I8]
MASFFKRWQKSSEEKSNSLESKNSSADTLFEGDPKNIQEEAKKSFFGRLYEGLSRTRSNLTQGIENLIHSKKSIDHATLEEIETLLLTADVGIEATQEIIADLTRRLSRKEIMDSKLLMEALRENMESLLAPNNQPFTIPNLEGINKPFTMLMVGINGVGKTTTIGKLAKKFQEESHSVMLAAGDTFRAAAVEQLQVWGERNQIPVIAQHKGADSASVIFDAIQSAKARNIDILLADTAGRLHTQANLMEELKKVKRVMGKADENMPHEVLLTIDAGTGQNALNQVLQFHQAVGLTGIIVTKLDGTAKGGIIFAIAKKTGLPIYFIGVGEKIDDLRPFNKKEFVTALLGLSPS